MTYHRRMTEDDPYFNLEFDAKRDHRWDFCPRCDELNDYCTCETKP